MGSDKCRIPLGHSTLLGHVLHALCTTVETVHVVGQSRQLREDVVPVEYRDAIVFIKDETPDLGPLEGLRVGLESLPSETALAFVCGCDTPLLSARFVSGMLHAAAGYEAAVPWIDGEYRPLPGVFARRILPQIREQLAKRDLSLWQLVERLDALRVSPEELERIEPGLQSLINVNDPATLETVSQIWAQRPPRSD